MLIARGHEDLVPVVHFSAPPGTGRCWVLCTPRVCQGFSWEAAELVLWEGLPVSHGEVLVS